MQTVLIIVHLIIVLALIGVVLLQRSEGGGLGLGGGGGGVSGFMTGRGQANALTRATAILGALFFITSLVLTLMANYGRAPRSIFDGAAPSRSGEPAGAVRARAGRPRAASAHAGRAARGAVGRRSGAGTGGSGHPVPGPRDRRRAAGAAIAVSRRKPVTRAGFVPALFFCGWQWRLPFRLRIGGPALWIEVHDAVRIHHRRRGVFTRQGLGVVRRSAHSSRPAASRSGFASSTPISTSIRGR